MGDKVTKIGAYALANNNLTYFEFEDNAKGVKEVGNYAFSNNKFDEILIPADITFGTGAFADNYYLKYIELDFEEDGTEKSIPNNMFYLSNQDTQVEKVEIYIPYNVKTIGKNAFRNFKYTDIIFEDAYENEKEDGTTETKPSMLTTIGNSAFKQDSYDKNDSEPIDLIIPGKVKTINHYAFENVKLNSLTFDEETTVKLGIGNASFRVEDCDGSSDGRSISFPATLDRIGIEGFKGQKLSSVSFGADLTTIGISAFEGNDLTSFSVPSNVEMIGEHVFGDLSQDNKKLSSISISDRKLFDTINWCSALYGVQNCEYGPASKFEETPDPTWDTFTDKEAEKENDYICKYNRLEKHIMLGS